VLTDQHIAEALSRAYVRAIAGQAGLNLAIREYEYGVLDSDRAVYDLEAKTYNDLILRRSMRAATPCILILLALPSDSAHWLICEETELRLQGTCYWEYLSGSLSENRASVRIRIPRSQRFTPESLSKQENGDAP
jgi:Domain of unknown function (DUF4365)